MKKKFSFNSDPALKQQYLDRLKSHVAEDRLVKGQYWEDGKGCAIGCILEGSDHMLFDTLFSIDPRIAYLVDRIFEGLPNAEAMTFPVEVFEAIPVGKDLSLVVPRFFAWLLSDEEGGVQRYIADDYTDCLRVMKAVRTLYLRSDLAKPEEWDAAGEAAWAAARAAWAAARDAARAAWAAGEAARAAAGAAAWAAAEAAAGAAAGDAAGAAAYSIMAKKLIGLLRSA